MPSEEVLTILALLALFVGTLVMFHAWVYSRAPRDQKDTPAE
jgi:hypothetical protein